MSGGERRVLVTGAAGFIGFHLCRRLLADGIEVLGLDNLNGYYDPALKRARLAQLDGLPGFATETADVSDHAGLLRVFAAFRPTHVAHLAAQAGVRHSLNDPRSYVSANVDGFLGILEACRHHPVRHLAYASSSSVYGRASKVPFAEADAVDDPVSLYAATKRANELMAQAYGHLFGVAATGLRFFTVYGPWGRPDMAYYSFTRAIADGREIEVFNEGRMSRDFTYVDDAVEAVTRLLFRPPAATTRLDGEPRPAHVIYNIGSQHPVAIERLIEIIAGEIGRPARKLYRPMQPGDVPTTYASMERLGAAIGYAPVTRLEDGIARFVAWFRAYHGPGGAA